MINKDETVISFVEACTYLGEPKSALYHRFVTNKELKTFKINGRLFVKFKDCLPLIEAEKNFHATHILVKEVNKKLFNTSRQLIMHCYYHNPQYSFFDIYSYHGLNYINKSEFKKFYEEIGRQPLVRLSYVLKLLDFRYCPKFYYLLELYSFYEEVRFFTLAKGGKKFYALSDIKAWCTKHNLITK